MEIIFLSIEIMRIDVYKRTHPYTIPVPYIHYIEILKRYTILNNEKVEITVLSSSYKLHEQEQARI